MTYLKSDLIDLKKSGHKSIWAKLNELRIELASTSLKVGRGGTKNVRSAKAIRRSIAQLKTILTQLKAEEVVKDKKENKQE